MRCLRHCDLKQPLENNTPHHQHIQSTVHKKKKKEAGLGTAWFYRLEFQSIAWDMQEGGVREGRREGGRTKLFCKQMRGNLGESESLPPLHARRRWCGPRRRPELQAKSDDNRANFYPATMYFTGSQWRKRPQSIVWEAPACVAPPFAIRPVAFPGLKQRLHIPNMHSEYWYFW